MKKYYQAIHIDFKIKKKNKDPLLFYDHLCYYY